MFHINFKRLRTVAGFSQKEVAEQLGLSPQSISKWECGTALPSIEYLPHLSELFSCEIKEFFAPVEKKTMLTIEELLSALKLLDEKTQNDGAKAWDAETIKEVIKSYEILMKAKKILSNFLQIRKSQFISLFSCEEQEANIALDYLVKSGMFIEIKEKSDYVIVKESLEFIPKMIDISQQVLSAIENKADNQ